MDTLAKEPGKYFERLPETYVIIITARDVLGHGRPLYVFERRTTDGLLLDEGSHIVYVNGAMRGGDTPLGKLMHDFFCERPEDMNYSVLADRTRSLKESEKGVRKMSSVMAQFKRAVRAEAKAEFLAEGRAEGLSEGLSQGLSQGRSEAQEGFVLKMLKAGELTLKKIAEYSGMTLAQVKAIQKSMA